MSWISGFADKAEQILMKIDQNAADKLQKKKPARPVQEAALTEVTTIPSPVPQRARLTPPLSPAKPPALPQVRSAPVMVNSTQEEDKLIDFLNDNSKPSESNGGKAELAAGGGDASNQLDGEKQMLRNEVRVLNNELSMLLHRTRAAERESENLKTEVQGAEKSQLDLQDELNKLKSQLKSLEQHNQTLVAEKRQQEELSGDAESTVQQLEQEMLTLRSQRDTLTQSLESKERECAALETARQQHQQQSEALTQQLTELQTQLDQYRARAQRTLNDKEALISQLRANNSDASVETSFLTELAQLREERQALFEEHQETSGQLQAARTRLAEVERTLETVRESAARTQQELQQRAAHEAHKRRIIEDDFRLQTQELRLVREEASAQRSQLSGRLREREAELSQLRSQLSSRPVSPSAHLLPGELEVRLSSLTKTLIQKQTALESATTERNQLRMQLEELEHKHREHLLLLHQARVISANDTDDVKAQVPSFMVESPFDTGVARRVKRAYSSLDAVSIRTGVFLRRYPLARILVILYVILLHSLVLLVLYSRTPDNAQK